MTPTAAADRDLAVSRLIDLPPEPLFRAWTDPLLLAQWWGPHGTTTSHCDIDLRPGGLFRTVMHLPDGTQHIYQGVYLEIVAPQRIVFTDAYGPGWVPAAHAFMTAITTFEAQGSATLYTAQARHWTVADRETHAKMGFHKGWTESLDRLVAVAARL